MGKLENMHEVRCRRKVSSTTTGKRN